MQVIGTRGGDLQKTGFGCNAKAIFRRIQVPEGPYRGPAGHHIRVEGAMQRHGGQVGATLCWRDVDASAL